MTDITIPDEVVEAAARAAYEYWRAGEDFLNETLPWEDIDEDYRRACLANARAVILAGLQAWPGSAVCHYITANTEGYEMVIPLPIKETDA